MPHEANKDLHVSDEGAQLIHGFESLQLTAYVDTKDKDGNPIYAIGYGHTSTLGNPTVHEGMTITEQEANEIWKRDVVIFENKVKQYINVPLTQNQFDALVCFAYNVRTSNFLEMLERSKLNEGNYDGVPEALKKYNVSRGRVLRGLTRRRQLEGELFSRK